MMLVARKFEKGRRIKDASFFVNKYIFFYGKEVIHVTLGKHMGVDHAVILKVS